MKYEFIPVRSEIAIQSIVVGCNCKKFILLFSFFRVSRVFCLCAVLAPPGGSETRPVRWASPVALSPHIGVISITRFPINPATVIFNGIIGWNGECILYSARLLANCGLSSNIRFLRFSIDEMRKTSVNTLFIVNAGKRASMYYLTWFIFLSTSFIYKSMTPRVVIL